MTRRNRPSRSRRKPADTHTGNPRLSNVLEQDQAASPALRGTWIVPSLLASYAVLAVVMTWPVAARLTTHIAGEHDDLYVAQWDCWWVGKVVSEGRNPLFTDDLFYPEGVSLRFHSVSWLTGLIAAPLRSLFGATAGYNLTFLLQTWLCAVAMFALVRHLTGRRSAAWMAGLIFAFAPYRMSQATAHPNLAFLAAVPLVTLFVSKAITDRKPRFAWLAGLSLALVLLTGAHIFIMTVALVTMIVTATLVRRRQWADRRAWIALAHFAAACVVLVAPLMFQYIGGAGEDAMGAALSLTEAETMQTDPSAWVTPSRYHPWWGDAFDAQYDKFVANRPWVATLGFAALGLCAIAAFHRRTRGPVVVWTIAGVAFALLCLGPKLRLGGQVHDFPMPYSLVGWLSPVQAIRTPDRFNLMLVTCVAVMAGWGWSALRQWRIRRAAWIMLPAMIILLEYWPNPYPTTPANHSAFYDSLAANDEAVAIMEIPLSRKPSKFAMYAQTVHGKPIVGGMVARTPPEAYAYIESSPLLTAWMDDRLPPLGCNEVNVREDLTRLRDAGVAYIVIRNRWVRRFTDGGWPRVFAVKPIYRDDILMAFSVEQMLAGALPCEQ